MDTAQTNPEFAACTESKIEAADHRLNAAWNRLFKAEGGSETDEGRALLNEQRAWLKFKEVACSEYFMPLSGREAQVIHGPLCIAAIINDRADDLINRYKLMNP